MKLIEETAEYNGLCFMAGWHSVNKLYLLPSIIVYGDSGCYIRFGITFNWLKFEVSLDSGY